MSYTILSAQWGNAEQTSAVVMTVEVAALAISAGDTPKDWADFQAWAAINPVAPVPTSTPSTKQQKLDSFFKKMGVTPAEFKAAIGAL